MIGKIVGQDFCLLFIKDLTALSIAVADFSGLKIPQESLVEIILPSSSSFPAIINQFQQSHRNWNWLRERNE